MKQLTPVGLIKIMAQVTAIMVIPMVGGAVAGILIDMALETTPLFVLIGLLLGTAVSAAGIWLLIRAGTRGGEPVARSPRHDG
jgi:F0F1-type ATP synthase assembly protein I